MGLFVTQVQELALGLAEPYINVPLIQISLQSRRALQQISSPTQLSVAHELTQGTLDTLIQIICKDTAEDWGLY